MVVEMSFKVKRSTERPFSHSIIDKKYSGSRLIRKIEFILLPFKQYPQTIDQTA